MLPSLLAIGLLLPLACKTKTVDDTGTPGDGGGTADGGGDTGTPVVDVCADMGLTVRPWQDAEESTAKYATAADITLQTTEGDLQLSSIWTGCESMLFIQDAPAQAAGWPQGVWDRDVDELFSRLPRNVHIFFSSNNTSTDSINASLDQIKGEVDDVLAGMTPDDALWWSQHVHYLTRRSQILDGWLGDEMTSPGWGVGIDRFQRLRFIGSYADETRYDASYGWFAPNLSMAANEAVYYNFESDRDDAMQAEGADVVTIFSGTRVAGSVDATVDLPDAGAMAGYDTVTVDAAMNCEGDGEYGYCPAWDYMAYLYECDMAAESNPYTDTSCQPAVAEVMGQCMVDGTATGDSCRTAEDCPVADTGSPAPSCEGYAAAISADTMTGTCGTPAGGTSSGTYTCQADGTGYGDLSCACSTEIGRWITTYHREGRWVHDISASLPLLGEGGTHRFRFETNGPYLLDVDLRFSNQGKAARPEQTVYLWDGGTINSTYNSTYEPIHFTPPAGVTKVELATVITQHGSDSHNCGEFCDIAHHFTVNGDTSQEIVRSFPETAVIDDCMQKTAEGTVPNQYGTWWYGRAGWCPGKNVPPQVDDITDQVTIGADNSISYQALYRGSDYDDSATILMRSWLVYSW